MTESAASPPSPPDAPAAAAPAKPLMKRHWMFIILALAFLFVLMPFLFWEATWFGRPLAGDQLAKSLNDTAEPREIQHALSQIADRILSPDAATRDSARPFYPDVVRVSQAGGDELRITAAWVMGQDNTSPDFHQALLRQLADTNPMVRRNAALSLVRFGDPAGHSEIRATLEPFAVPAPAGGTIEERLKPGDEINPGTLLGHIASGNVSNEVRSQVPGTIVKWLVADSAAVTSGEQIVAVAPSSQEQWEALRALYLIGTPEDLPPIDAIARGGTDIPQHVQQQAQNTAQAIRTRASASATSSK